MDKDQARFILRTFRPDGADANDADFTAALELAAGDRELGEWLSRERAFDADFAEALRGIPIPPDLRDDILAGLAAGRADLPQADGPLDAAMIGALASIAPPERLRGEILAAMATSSARGKRPPFWKRAAIPIAAAAGIALAFLITRPTDGDLSNHITADGTLPVEFLEAGFIRTYESPLFSLDTRRENHGELLENLRERKLPCPKLLPPGLRDVKSIGCRELVIDGKRGSLVCFDENEAGTIHLVIFRREDICGDIPCKNHPFFASHGDWAVARWADETHVYLLLGITKVDRISSLF